MYTIRAIWLVRQGWTAEIIRDNETPNEIVLLETFPFKNKVEAIVVAHNLYLQHFAQ